MIRKIDHVAFVVRNLDEALDVYVNLLGFEKSDILIPEKGEKFKSVIVSQNQVMFELIQPTDTKGGIKNFLDKRGGGIHHVSLEVDDIWEEINRLSAKGIKFLTPEPEQVEGALVTFVDPRSSSGILIELIERK
ncbi:MAG: VOC family protein [Deltaproteobacteria bacterium]|nr:VOC family protein [Deltaproteobacteria bacterium]